MGSEVGAVVDFMANMQQVIVFYLNGSRREIRDPDPEMTLLEYVRTTEGLTGSKLGCGEGGCGACTVMASSYDPQTDKVVHRSVNGCLFPLVMADNLAITTVEGIGSKKTGLHPVQERIANGNGSQCGFCTPGIVMSMYTLLRQKCAEGEEITALDIEENFDGNLCRCTGYRPILDAFKTFATSDEGGCCRGGKDGCPCKSNGTKPTTANGEGPKTADENNEKGPTKGEELLKKEMIFPRELVERKPPSLNISSATGKWFRPTSLEELLSLKKQFPNAKMVAGNTEIGIERKFKSLECPVQIGLNHVDELAVISKTEVGLEIGSGATLTSLLTFIQATAAEKSNEGCESILAVAEQLKWFAGKQIRNVAALGGNIVTASPISDLNPVWVATKSKFVMVSVETGNERVVPAKDFFIAYRKVDLGADEVLLKVIVPWTKPFEMVSAYKVTRRKDDDIAIVTCAIRLDVEEEGQSNGIWNIVDAGFGFGGVAAKTVSAKKTEQAIIGQELSPETMQLAMDSIGKELEVAKGAPGGMAEFRSSLVVSFLFKAFYTTLRKVHEKAVARSVSGPAWKIDGRMESVAAPRIEKVSNGVQIYDKHKGSNNKHVGQPISHVAAELQASGEAAYVDDIPTSPDCLFAGLVISSKPHAKILGIDFEKCLETDDVVDVVTVKDVPGKNIFGVGQDELVFATDEVTCIGQVIALVLAKTQRAAHVAAKMVKVDYEELPAIITIEDAISEDSYLTQMSPRRAEHGNVDEAFAKAPHIVEGEVNVGGQEHFYLETMGCLAIPAEDDEITIFSSTQAASPTQAAVAQVLGVPMHKVVSRVKRIGGGFGGKESRSIFLAVAVATAAKKLNKPVRMFFDRDMDMISTGTRHPFYGKYKVAFDDAGKLLAYQCDVFSNAGNTLDLSIGVIERAVYHIENAYNIPNVRVVARVCYTNTPSNTAFRGFGGPQGMFFAENAVEHVATVLNRTPESVRALNLYEEGDETPYGMTLTGCTMRRCWDEVVANAKVEKRREAIKEFNLRNRYHKRGLAVIPVKFGISFTFRVLNQAGALVHIYTDGTVLVTHGGVEMGQGLHSKMIQVAAHELGVPLENVYITETATDKVPNASPSAASASADMYGMAVKNACDQLNERLAAAKKALGPKGTWAKIVGISYAERVNLSAQGFYSVPDLDQLNLGDAGRGRPFYYFTYGAAVSEVEVDCLTGEHENIYSEIVMDVGRSLNPAIDIGQIEGAFVQGMGMCTMEELVRGGKTASAWLPDGFQFTQGPSTYKIPGFRDIPKDFKVTLLSNAPNPEKTIHQSKAVGEPPLFLAYSIFFAIRDAIKESRQEFLPSPEGRAASSWFELDSPATAERIRMACADGITGRYADPMTFRAAAFI